MRILKKIDRETKRILKKMPWNRHAHATEIHIGADAINEIGALPYLREKPTKFHRITIPIDIMVMTRGVPFTASANPFVAALDVGDKPLRDHYENFQPKNLAQMYHLSESGRAGEKLGQFHVPWMPGEKSSLKEGEAGLGAEHGISHYGPVSDEKLDREMRRLISTLESIKKNGFDPVRFGDIKGYFMRSGDQYRFQIAGGKHRIAVLAFLGNSEAPVRMREGWPRLVDRADYMNWPRVMDGTVDPEFALNIFDRHFE